MSHLREDIERTNLDIPEGEIKIVSAADPVYANALEVHKEKKDETEKTMAKKEEEVKDGVLGIKGKTTAYPKTKDLKKMKLSEKLFEDYEDSDWKSIDKEVEKDLWTSIYNELNGDIKRLDARTRRFVKKPSERYSEDDLSTSGDVITVYADDNERLDFAREVAEEYGVEYKVTEHTSRYAPAKFSIKIYTSQPVTNESLDNAKIFGRKANKKDLTESANGEICGKVIKYFEYSAPEETVDTICDIVDRAVSNIEDGYDLEEAVSDAIDNGLIYNKDNWAIKHYYEDPELADGTYESLYDDVYSIVSDLTDKDDVDEGLTRAEIHNRHMDKIFQDKKDRDARMSKFLKDNSNITDDELKKVQGDDRVGLELKNRGLHDRYWNEVEGKNESLNEDKITLDDKDKDRILDESVNNVQNHQGSFASIIEQNIDEIDSLINKGDRDALLNRLQELVDEANLTGKNLERANSYMRGLRTKRDLSSLAVSLYDIKLAAMDKENKVITTNKKRHEDYENRELEEDVVVNKYGLGGKLKSSISKFFQGQQDFENALDDGKDFKRAVETAKKKSSERDEEKRLEQQKLSHKRENRLLDFIIRELIDWRDDHGGHTRGGSTRLTKYIEDIRKQGEKHPTIISAAKKMRVSPSEYYSMWDKAADTALKFKKTPTAKIKISYK